jgi:hypothetical protein
VCEGNARRWCLCVESQWVFYIWYLSDHRSSVRSITMAVALASRTSAQALPARATRPSRAFTARRPIRVVAKATHVEKVSVKCSTSISSTCQPDAFITSHSRAQIANPRITAQANVAAVAAGASAFALAVAPAAHAAQEVMMMAEVSSRIGLIAAVGARR